MNKKSFAILVAIVFVAGYFSAPAIIPVLSFVISVMNNPTLTVENSLKSDFEIIEEFENIKDVKLFRDRYQGEIDVNPSRSISEMLIVRYSSEFPASESKAVLSVAKYPDESTVSEFQCVNYEKNLQYSVHEGEITDYLENYNCFEYNGPIFWKDANLFYGFTYPKSP